jgi:acetyl esterase
MKGVPLNRQQDHNLLRTLHRTSTSRRGFLGTAATLAGGATLISLLGTQPATAQAQALPAPVTLSTRSVAAQMGADPQMQEILDTMAMLGVPPLESLAPRQARETPTVRDAVLGVLAKHQKPAPVEMVGKVEHRVIPGPSPEGTLVRIYTPIGDGPFPVTVYYHGGGWVIANLNAYDGSARAITNQANTIVVSVAYRQAPEFKFPAAHEDAFSAYQWVTENAASMNGDPNRVAVAGESAGGNLATAAAMMAHEKGVKMPVHQLLVYPITQYGFDTPSYLANADAKPLSRPLMQWFFAQYLRTEADGQTPWISPLRAPDLSMMPPTTLITAEIDPLRSEGQEYASRLKESGVSVMHMDYPGVTHEFFGTGPVVDKANNAVEFAGSGLRSSFGA